MPINVLYFIQSYELLVESLIKGDKTMLNKIEQQTPAEQLYVIVDNWLDKHTTKIPYMVCNGFQSRKDKADFIRMLRRLQFKRDEQGSLRYRYYLNTTNTLLPPKYYHEVYAHISCFKTNGRQQCFNKEVADCVAVGLYKGC